MDAIFLEELRIRHITNDFASQLRLRGMCTVLPASQDVIWELCESFKPLHH